MDDDTIIIEDTWRILQDPQSSHEQMASALRTICEDKAFLTNAAAEEVEVLHRVVRELLLESEDLCQKDVAAFAVWVIGCDNPLLAETIAEDDSVREGLITLLVNDDDDDHYRATATSALSLISERHAGFCAAVASDARVRGPLMTLLVSGGSNSKRIAVSCIPMFSDANREFCDFFAGDARVRQALHAMLVSDDVVVNVAAGMAITTFADLSNQFARSMLTEFPSIVSDLASRMSSHDDDHASIFMMAALASLINQARDAAIVAPPEIRPDPEVMGPIVLCGNETSVWMQRFGLRALTVIALVGVGEELETVAKSTRTEEGQWLVDKSRDEEDRVGSWLAMRALEALGKHMGEVTSEIMVKSALKRAQVEE